jgi:hypothetical protein
MGRNGALILANQPAALHVMLDGLLGRRIERVDVIVQAARIKAGLHGATTS